MASARQKLFRAYERTQSLLSVGLEPSLDYLPERYSRNLEGCEEFLGHVVEATKDIACAYKFNLAFFEAHGWEGMELLYTIREQLPDGVLIIADAKRSDIGTSARQYATALYDRLDVDAATVNPLMGRDSVEPFLNYTDRLTFFLVLTSNEGASDFLVPGKLYIRIAEQLMDWSNGGKGCGFVTGATRPAMLGEIRGVAPEIPFLVPGVGAQQGDLEQTLRHARTGTIGFPGLLIHSTRGLLPGVREEGDPVELIREKALALRDRITANLSDTP